MSYREEMGGRLRIRIIYTLYNKNCMDFKDYMDYMLFFLLVHYGYTSKSSKFDTEVLSNC